MSDTGLFFISPITHYVFFLPTLTSWILNPYFNPLSILSGGDTVIEIDGAYKQDQDRNNTVWNRYHALRSTT
jgi:hypothetical protein